MTGKAPLPFLRREDEATSAVDTSTGPPFCLETAAKSLAGSTLTYLEPGSRGLTKERYEELLSLGSTPLVSPQDGGPELKLLENKEFYNCKGANTVRCLCIAISRTKKNSEPSKKNTSSSCTEGWIRVFFRGTDTFKNVVADAKALRVSHPPRRGVKFINEPAVHHGFIDAWTGDELKASVTEFVLRHAKELSKEAGRVIVDISGHSLGGSIAVLAAYDLAVALQQQSGDSAPSIRLYTYGCPRVGNTSFVRDFNQVVPHCWNVINDNDIVPAVPHSPFFVLGYTRHGRSVIVKEDGTMIIDPTRKQKSAREARVLKLDSALTAHETGSYRRTLRAVFQAEGLLDPNDKRSTPELRALDERLGTLDAIITEARADPNRSKRLLPGAT